MQYFQDTTTTPPTVYAFNPDVEVTNTGGVYSFATAKGVALSGIPTTLQPCAGNVPPPVVPSAPTQAQLATAALAAGLAVTSTNTPALNATYPVSGSVWSDLKDEATFIQSFGAFSSGTSSITFVLSSTVSVTFTATSQLQAVVKALGMYITALKVVVATNTGPLPAAAVTIA